MSLLATKKAALPAASGALNARFGTQVVTYARLYRLILDGRLPADQVNGRYQVDLDLAAEVLGLTEKAAA